MDCGGYRYGPGRRMSMSDRGGEVALGTILYPGYHVRHDEYLLAFNLETEQFRTMRLLNIPDEGHHGWDENFRIALVSFEGLLGLWHYGRRGQSGSVALWLMETYRDSQT